MKLLAVLLISLIAASCGSKMENQKEDKPDKENKHEKEIYGTWNSDTFDSITKGGGNDRYRWNYFTISQDKIVFTVLCGVGPVPDNNKDFRFAIESKIKFEKEKIIVLEDKFKEESNKENSMECASRFSKNEEIKFIKSEKGMYFDFSNIKVEFPFEFIKRKIPVIPDEK